MAGVPAIRIRDCNTAEVRGRGEYVLYWMIASRRLRWNFGLDRALEYCEALDGKPLVILEALRWNFGLDRALEYCEALDGKPLVILEALRCDYQWASERLHRFVIEGMKEKAEECAKRKILYYPYVEPEKGAGSGLLEALSAKACVVVTDDFPGFFLPRMVAAAGKKLGVRLEAVDSNGLLPLRATDQTFARAFDFRRYLQKELARHLEDMPAAKPLEQVNFSKTATLPKSTDSRWAPASVELLEGKADAFAELPVDHRVRQAVARGGEKAAGLRLKDFLREGLGDYGEKRNEPDEEGSSGLSPYLHFGQVSAHEVFARVAQHENWNRGKLGLRDNGSREGWWNMSAAAEAFLDQLITWRELGYNFSAHREDADRYDSLPGWAKKTLKQHEKDGREYTYTSKEFETAKTHDALWNAAQRQLVREGRIHNYLRMLWGKKILEWTKSPEDAAKIMVHLNDKYALDGRDPNSYSGIFWILGRYDRPWGPERPVFGLIRYMSSENTARKLSVKKYLQKYGEEARDGAILMQRYKRID